MTLSKLKLEINLAHFQNYINHTNVSRFLSKDDTDPIILELGADKMYAKSYNKNKSFVRYTQIGYDVLINGEAPTIDHILVPVLSLPKLDAILKVLSAIGTDTITLVIGYMPTDIEVKDVTMNVNVAAALSLSAGTFKHKMTCASLTMGRVSYLSDKIWTNASNVEGDRSLFNFELEPTDVSFVAKILSLDNNTKFKLDVGVSHLKIQSMERGVTNYSFEGNIVYPEAPVLKVVGKKNFIDMLAMDSQSITTVHFNGKQLVSKQGDTVLINSLADPRE